MDESLLGGIWRIQLLKILVSATGMRTYFHISPEQPWSLIRLCKVLRLKKWNAPSTAKTPSPSNDLNWKCTKGPKDVICQPIFCTGLHATYPCQRHQIGWQELPWQKDTASITDMNTTWLKYLDMVRFDREELQAQFFFNDRWTRDKQTHVLEYRWRVLIGMRFHILWSSRAWSRLTRKLLVFGYERGSIIMHLDTLSRHSRGSWI